MTTAANIIRSDQSHWYYPDSRPCYELPKKDGSGMKVPTLRDAKQLGLLPSVTTILKCLDKPGLNRWLQEQAVLAAITSPRLAGETDDAFIERVLNVERQQDQEAQKARDLGTDIHAAIELALQGKPFPDEMNRYVMPVIEAVTKHGRVEVTEQIVVGGGYAGKMDCATTGNKITIWDFKTSKKLPTNGKSWNDHRLQLAAYCAAYAADRPATTANIYISTVEPGQIAVCVNDDWRETFERGFVPVLRYWQWANGV